MASSVRFAANVIKMLFMWLKGHFLQTNNLLFGLGPSAQDRLGLGNVPVTPFFTSYLLYWGLDEGRTKKKKQ